MSNLRFGASVTVLVGLLGLCALLASPAFDLPAEARGSGLGAGAFPQFVVVAVAILSCLILVQDLLQWRQPAPDRGAPDPEGDDFSSDPGRVLRLGTGVFLLLAAFIFAWPWLGFLPVAITFMAALALLLSPAAARTGRGVAITLVTSVLFCTGLWALFVHVLAVPLR